MNVTDMQRKHVICAHCRRDRPHAAHGLCRSCYNGATQQATAFGPLDLPDPASRLPLPPMVRCAGAPGLCCDRAARADVGRCWRCQQEAARAGVAA